MAVPRRTPSSLPTRSVLGAGIAATLPWLMQPCRSVCNAAERTIRWDRSTLTLVARGGYGRMIRLQDRAILCSVERGGKSWTMRSADDGRTWGEAVLAAEYEFGPAANPETLELRNGGILLAYNERPRDGGHPFAIRTCLSRDAGRTWRPHSLVYEAGARFENGCWEPAMTELPSGEVQLYFANEGPYRKSNEQEISLARSSDRGRTWTRPERISFRARRRDGMPVPLVLKGGKGGKGGKRIVVAIEDNGLSGRMKPVIVHTTMADNWRSGHVSGASPRRWGALRDPLPAGVYAGAPYIAQFPTGETALSVQSTERRGDDDPVMVVYVGDAGAKGFAGRSVPFDVARGKSGKWNSLFVKHADTVTAISGTTVKGVGGLWAIDGRLVRE